MEKINLITFTFYVLIGLIVSQISDMKNRTLDYYLDEKIYSIEEKENHINIAIKKIIDCKIEPCDFPIIQLFEIKNEKDYKNLKLVLDEIFNKTKIMKKSVIDEDLSAQQIQKIFTVFENNNITSKLNYTIIDDIAHYHDFSERGYTYQRMKWHYYTICSGIKASGGNSIDIKGVKIRGYSVIVFVKEYMASGGKTAALTYPKVKIRFNKKPTKITFINFDNGQEYPRIN